MPRNNKSRSETRTSFMYPELHGNIVNAVSYEMPSPLFHDEDSDQGCDQKWTTFIKGTFKCRNYTCRNHLWTSGVVAILIRGYPGNRYNAVVFNQHCKQCNELGTFKLDEGAYVERVTRRLKVWAGVPVEQLDFGTKNTPLHETGFCEGCKRGLCRHVRPKWSVCRSWLGLFKSLVTKISWGKDEYSRIFGIRKSGCSRG